MTNSEIRRAIMIMTHTNNNAMYIHSEVLNLTHDMKKLTRQELVDLAFEIVHAIAN